MDNKEELRLPPPREEALPAHATPEKKIEDESLVDYQLKTLLSWSAPGRPFQKKTKEYYLNILIIMLLVEVILFLFSQYVVMVLVVALVFLAYALNSVPPHDFHYKITMEGVMVEDHFFLWEELYDFSFKKQNGVDTLLIGTKQWYPGVLTIVLGEMHTGHVRDLLLQFLPYREFVKPTFMDKSSGWLEKNFPLERQGKATKSSEHPEMVVK